MDIKTNLKPLKVIGGYPLRGSVKLNSSPTLTKFIISLGYLLKGKFEIRGVYGNKSVEDFVSSLKNIGYSIKYDSEVIYTDSFELGSDVTILSFDSLESHFMIALSLESRGYVEVVKNKELVDFLVYLGFVAEKKTSDVYIIYNKIVNPRKALVFQELNYKYLLIGILFQFLNLDSFSITFPDNSVETSLLIDILQEISVLENVDQSNNVQLNFLRNTKSNSSYTEITIPGDPLEFCFFTTLSLYTEGEIQISGLDPKLMTSLLRLYSSIGGGYDANNSDFLRIWFSGNSTEGDLTDSLESTDRDYLTLLLSGLGVGYNEPFTLPIVGSSTKSLIQDINRLGGNIFAVGGGLRVSSVVNYKGGSLYLEGNIFSDFSRLILSLISEADFDIYNIKLVEDYNFKLLSKLEKLGARIS